MSVQHLSGENKLFKKVQAFLHSTGLGNMAFRALSLHRLGNLANLGKVQCQGHIVKLGLTKNKPCFIFSRLLHQDYKLVYEGPLSKTVKYVKTFSLATCLASVIGSPILLIYGKQSVPLAGKIGLAAIVLTMGTTTTFILHWFTRVYVHRMFYNPYKKSFAVETMNVLARRKITYFPIEHVNYPVVGKAFSTFSAEGKHYFLHMELREAEVVMNYIKERNLTEMQQ